MDLQPYVGLFIQIPLVFAFIWFSLNMLDKFLKALADRDAQLAKRETEWNASLERRDNQWKIFLEEQRKANHEAIAHMAERFADEIKTLGKEVAEVRGRIDV